MNYALLPQVNQAAFIVFFAYFIILIVYYFALAIFGMIEGIKWSRKGEEENYPLAYFTSFNIPVSIVIPAHNEELWIKDTVKSILNLNYPKYELIVVDDGSTDKTFEILDYLLDLKATDMVYTRHYKDGKTYNVLKSRKYPQVTVIRKDTGLKKAGAVNSGLNIAKYDYVCVLDADTVLDQDSLLKIMTQVQKDPENIVGITSYFGLSNGFKIKDGVIIEKNFSYRPIIAYQNLEYIRSFFGNRISLSRFDAMPNVAGGFGIWRRDILYPLGGYSADFTCEDLEFTFRAHKYIADNKKKFRIIMLPYPVSWTDGPDNLKSLIQQRNRWHRVEIETAWKYKSMFFNPKYGYFGFLALPYYVFYEILGMFFGAASLIFIIIGWWSGLIDWKTFFVFLIFMWVTQTTVSLISLLTFISAQKLYPAKYVACLVFLGLTEVFWYRWPVSWGIWTGTLHFLRGNRIYDQYDRVRQKDNNWNNVFKK